MAADHESLIRDGVRDKVYEEIERQKQEKWSNAVTPLAMFEKGFILEITDPHASRTYNSENGWWIGCSRDHQTNTIKIVIATEHSSDGEEYSLDIHLLENRLTSPMSSFNDNVYVDKDGWLYRFKNDQGLNLLDIAFDIDTKSGNVTDVTTFTFSKNEHQTTQPD